MKKTLILAFLLLTGTFFGLPAQNSEPADSLVRLMSAQSVRMVQTEGKNIREVVGPASFLHNGTFLLCDTAVWNVDTKIINAMGNVQIIQNETVLTSDRLDYITDLSVAQFRGRVVQLVDKDRNTLRTTYLDYNTKDSVALFDRGGSLRDKDGQIIESLKGSYDSKIKTFTFEDAVNMYADSIYVKTARLKYYTDREVAEFFDGVDAWKDESMLSSVYGKYYKAGEVFFFNDSVHVLTGNQEGWSDSLYFYRNDKAVEMFGNAQVTDTTRNVSAVADHIRYVDSLSRATMTGDAAVIARIKEKKDSIGTADTLYLGARRITLNSLKMYQVSSADTAAAAERRREMYVDPVSEYRAQAAEAAAAEIAKAREEKMKREGQLMPGKNPGGTAPEKATDDGGESVPEGISKNPAPDSLATAVPADSLAVSADSLSVPAADSLAVSPADSLATVVSPPDTSAVHFVEAYGDVKLFKKDIQACCDSLVFNDIDSLARMYNSPAIWNEGNRQYVADSIFLLVKGSTLDRANLLSNAFIMIKEDEDNFDQVRSTEMMAYFDSTSALKRFDALGEAHAVFHLKEEGKVTMTNKVETRMLSTLFVDGQLDRVSYYDKPKNDAYPIVQLPQELRKMKGFSWDPERRPESGADITSHLLRSSQRGDYERRTRPEYLQTEKYFPGYMQSVADTIAARRARERALEAKRKAEAEARDLAAVEASRDSVSVSDSLSVNQPADTVAVASDTLATASVAVQEKVLSPSEQRAAERKAKREARFAELDRRDAERAAAKAEKDRIKRQKKALKFLEKRDKQLAKEEAKIKRYMEKYEKRSKGKSK